MNSSTRPGPNREAGLFLDAGSAVVSLIVFGLVVWGISRGIDLTDEGYALNAARYPFIFRSYSQFGALLHPIYSLVEENLILYRLCGLLLLALAASLLVSGLLRSNFVAGSLWRKFALGISCASCSLAYYFQWMPTPNYNLLTHVGVLIIFIGWFQIVCDTATAPPRLAGRLASLVVGASGFAIVALAKPTTAAVLAVTMPALAAAFGRRAVFDVLAAGALAILAVASFLIVIDGGIASVIQHFLLALKINSMSDSGHDLGGILKSFDLGLGLRGWATLLLMAALGPILSLAFSANATSVGIIVAILVLLLEIFLFRPLMTSNFFIVYWSIAIQAATGRLTDHLRRRDLEEAVYPNRKEFAAIAALVLAPIAIALGTNTSIWLSAGRASIFWVLATLLFSISQTREGQRTPWPSWAVAANAVFLMQSMIFSVERPYRIVGPLSEQTEWIASTGADRVVKTDPQTAAYFRELRVGAMSSGFTIGTGVIDTTGIGPTAEYILGAEPLGLPWIPGGYPGSRNLAFYSLSSVPIQKLRRAWILTSPAGKESLPLDILAELGLSFPKDYEEVARARTGYFDEVHVLWRPRTSK